MAYTLVQNNGTTGTTSGTSIPVTYTSNVTAGSLLVFAFTAYTDTDVVTSVADSLGQTWTRAGIGAANGLAERPYIYYFFNTAGGACTVTITQSVSSGHTLQVYEYAGCPTTDPLDITTPGSGSGTAPSVTLAGCAADDLLFGAAVSQGTPTPGSGFTGLAFTNNWFENFEYKLDSGTAGSQAVNWTGSSTWSAIGVSFKSVAASVSTSAAWPMGTRKASAKAGPYDQRGFLKQLWQRYSFVPIPAPVAVVKQRKTLSITGNHVGGRRTRNS